MRWTHAPSAAKPALVVPTVFSHRLMIYSNSFCRLGATIPNIQNLDHRSLAVAVGALALARVVVAMDETLPD